ncbi:hypothetical protein NDU88_007018 [Pleurodeles waltl]|uniref:t-SNARE coiled-coil homology domain-containing protein n=1 Tax=Pleurodeles waltl TaxID=8319 RepID=A0AAV7RSV0_PLEWA|nr:hypothetical protein NDU88_007018 [Pleurodeles waltl]
MGKHDAKQPKLNFDHKRSTRQGELEQGPQAAEGRDLAADDQGEDLRTLMLEMRSSLRNIDTKLDNLTSQLDSVKTQVAIHETRKQMRINALRKSFYFELSIFCVMDTAVNWRTFIGLDYTNSKEKQTYHVGEKPQASSSIQSKTI